jgi:cytochrome c-type biogenesis protein CcmH/NrfG
MLPRRLPDGGAGVPHVSLERAQLNLEAAVQKAPDNIEARYWLAKLYETLQMPDKALAAWTKAGELAGTKPEHARMAPEIAEAIARLKR